MRADRERMVAQQIVARGIQDERLLEAMRSVPRHRFVPESERDRAHDDSALSIGEGQTISQPYVVALMIEALALRPGDRVLDVGSGSGYAAAVIGLLATEVLGIERVPTLAERSARLLAELGFDRVRIIQGDGSGGAPEGGPWDAIAVAAGSPRVPAPLVEQLAVGGRMVLPVGETASEQVLVRLTRLGPDDVHRENLGRVRFVPLVGREGWASETGPGALPED